uniref:Uncharacterized protein n=1 Tax=Arundo donax TaxID=35708 RepID=A0A0A9GAV3_ARUDO
MDLLSLYTLNKESFYKMGGTNKQILVQRPHFTLLFSPISLSWTETTRNWRGKQLHQICNNTGHCPETYYTPSASSNKKIGSTSTGQIKESPHPRFGLCPVDDDISTVSRVHLS